MKKNLLIGILLMVGLSFTFGQTSSDSITMKKVFGGYQFYQGDKRLNMSKLVKTMQPNEQAYKEIKKAQSTYTLATIFGAAGGFMVGWSLGTALAGGDPNWALAGVGAGLIVVSIPISQKFNKQAKTAVNTFNGNLSTSSFWDKTEIRLVFSGNGVGFIMDF
jgi:hypothetical protein